ncbi:MAG TPA: methyltransferase domain-containing protein [Ktedonobacteraceae bacterium]|jgi:ubiquinone/menaquinone biosynthesis C-methylase UbiE
MIRKMSIPTEVMQQPRKLIAGYTDAHLDARLYRYMQHIMGNRLIPAPISMQGMRTVLDIGCGAGDWLIDLAHRYPSVQMYGLDINQETLKLARERSNYSHLTNIQWRQIDSLQDVSLPDSYVDLIHLRRCHYWITPQRWRTFFAACARLLKPGGWIAVTNIEMTELSSSAFVALRRAQWRTLNKLHHCMDPTANNYGSLPRLPRMLHESSFSRVGYELYAIDLGFMSGLSGQCFLSNLLQNIYSTRDTIIAQGELTEDTFDALFSQLRLDVQDPYLCGWGFLISAWGRCCKEEEGR